MQTTKSLKYWQWRTIVVTMIGYAMFYLVRKNFSFSMPGLGAEFGITKTQLGLFLTLHGVIYGLSRYVVNILFGTSDAVAAWVVSIAGKAGDAAAIASVLVYVMGVLWMINGFLQGMGVPPCTKTLTQWIHPKELATKMSIWNMSHSIGAGLAMALCGWLVMPHLGVDMSLNPEVVSSIAANLNLDMNDPASAAKVTSFAAHFGAWRWCFLIPAGVAILGSVWLFFFMKDSPSDVGLPEVVGKKKAIVTTPEEAAEHKAFVRKHVYGNRVIWTLAVTNFFVYVVRFAALDWGPTLLTESKGLSMANATTLCVVFELIGGNLGMLFWGWATDHIFRNKAHHTCVVCMVGVALCVAAFWVLPSTAAWWVMLIPFTFLGFCIYGPQALLGVIASNDVSKKAASSAVGVIGFMSYFSTLITGYPLGKFADTFGWHPIFILMAGVSVVGTLVIATIWNLKPKSVAKEDGEEK